MRSRVGNRASGTLQAPPGFPLRQAKRRQEPCADSLSAVPYRLDKRGVPLIEGGLAHFVCSVEEQLEGGDHTIFIGRVEDGGIDRDTDPLLFYAGGYRRFEAARR